MHSNCAHPDWWGAVFGPDAYPHPVSNIELIETHISWVILTGDWIYKLKKPVDMGFADFTTLDRRYRACLEELRLNRRTAPDLYQDVVSLVADPAGPRFGGQGAVLDYAVRMRQFPQSVLFEHCLERGELTEDVIVALADEVADLHERAAVAQSATEFGEPLPIQRAVHECLEELINDQPDLTNNTMIDAIRQWVIAQNQRLAPVFHARKAAGRVRECHGDLHLGNLILLHGKPTLFDCIEFNETLRWIDVISDIAFLVMDLFDHDRQRLGWRFLNAWLERTGDFDGLSVLSYYLVYRALVRAKVDAIRLKQPDLPSGEQSRLRRQLDGYVLLAKSFTEQQPRGVVLMHGLSGSGKTCVARKLATDIPAVHIRSDVERKRLFSLWPAETSPRTTNIYSAQATQHTYRYLAESAAKIVNAGLIVIIDATFLSRADRSTFAQLADQLHVPFVIRTCETSIQELRRRVIERQQKNVDASDAGVEVIDFQLRWNEPFESEELPFVARTDQECLRLIRNRNE